MVIRLYGNQHGHFVKFDGPDLAKLEFLAQLLHCTPQEAFDRAVQEKLQRERLA